MKKSKQAAAQKELARRKLARRSLIEFCCYVDPGAAYEDAADPYLENRYRAAHLELMADYIERAIDGSLFDGIPGDGKKILLITTPPGHWKSSLISRKLPAWYVGKRLAEDRPHQVILTSYNSKLAQANNARVLELMTSPLYQNVFPGVTLSKSQQNSEEWAVDGMPFTSCVARGVGAGLTGNHGALAIVDDPIKDRKDANSATVRETLWDWWKDVLRTRIIGDGFILGVWTRWTEDDPAGRIMDLRRKGVLDDRVVMLRLPALAETQAERISAGTMGLPIDDGDPLGREPGEALWPEKEDAAAHEATRRAFPLTFDSLYQGRPRPKGGYIVGGDQFKTMPSRPEKNVRWMWGTDWAITEKEVAPKRRNDPDYTVAALVGLWTPEGDFARLVIARVVRGQHDPHRARMLVKGAMLAEGRPYPMRSGQANIDKVHLSQMRQDPDLLQFSIKNLSRSELSGDKVTKAQPWLEMVHAGHVYLVDGAWNDAFVNEAENFPNGTHDDQIDAVSVAVHALGLYKRREIKQAKVAWYG
jgi:hypothetical protein